MGVVRAPAERADFVLALAQSLEHGKPVLVRLDRRVGARPAIARADFDRRPDERSPVLLAHDPYAELRPRLDDQRDLMDVSGPDDLDVARERPPDPVDQRV